MALSPSLRQCPVSQCDRTEITVFHGLIGANRPGAGLEDLWPAKLYN